MSIVITRLQEIDSRLAEPAYQTMFLSDSPRPSSGERVPKPLGFADSGERVPQNSLDQLQDAQRSVAIGLNPIAKILSKFAVENGNPLSGPTAQVPSPDAAWKLTPASLVPFQLSAAP